MSQTKKTIIFAGNAVGGQYKSTTIAILGDCLQSLGHTVKFIALEVYGKPMLKKLYPSTALYDPRSTEALYQALQDAVGSPEDIVIIDCPGGGWGEQLPELVSLAQQELGARIIIAPIVDAQSEHSIEGAAYFINLSAGSANEYAVLANNWEENPERHNMLLKSEGGKIIFQLAQGRVLKFAPFSAAMLQDFNQNPAVPSAFIADTKSIRAMPWKCYHKQCLQSVAEYADWLTGRTAAKPFHAPKPQPNISEPNIAQLERIMAEASRHFLQTGEIPDTLLQCFDQNGKWLEDTAASEFVDLVAELKLAEITIPESRRSITKNGESILLTSYVLDEEPEDERLVEEYLTEEELPEERDPILVLPWHEIRGMCQVAIHRNLYCPNLRRFNPHYQNTDMSALTIRFPELTEVDCITLTAQHISVPKLESAKYLAFRTVPHIHAPNLKHVGHLQLGTAFSAHFPVLREVNDALVGYAIREFFAPLLEAVNRRKTGHDGLVLPDAWTIDTPNLKHVGKRLDAYSAETFCPQGLVVDGRWERHPNAKTH